MTTHKLSDLQIILLSAASRHETGSLLPLPSAAAEDLVRTDKAIGALVRKGLAEKLPVTDRCLAWGDANQEPTGVFITAAGRDAIGFSAGDSASESSGGKSGPSDSSNAGGKDPAAAAAAINQPRAGSKTALVLDLLRGPNGATLAELVAVTGWLPHTTRAALTSLRKKGYAIARGKRDEVTTYAITAAA